ncbi:hypothetical protein Ciccas_012263 [Cichlidogyrus casuarinus]|uniref:D-3-phosphoglycerate dehydrogenase n=1 Tax=Cichlidogyrus casuarinus TaxID=1844966 RepID=A0ABD2PRX2_9PLAT
MAANNTDSQELVLVPSLRCVLVLDKVAKLAVNLLKEAGLQVHEGEGGMGADSLTHLINHIGADAVIVRSATKITDTIFANCPSLKVIARAGVGVDNIDVAAATAAGVLVINAPEGNTLSAAEHTCSLITALSRQLHQTFVTSIEDYASKKKSVTSGSNLISELQGKCLAILGLGRIGQTVGKRLHAFGMRVIGYDPLWTKESVLPPWLDELFVDLDKLWPEADYISLHMPLIPATRHLVNRAALSLCKPGVRIVNCARGGIIDEDALVEALEQDKCLGAALDVLEVEPPQENGTGEALIKHPRCLVTPHHGASSCEAQNRVAVEVATALCRLAGKSKGVALNGAINLNASGNAYLASMRRDPKLTEFLTNQVPRFAFALATRLVLLRGIPCRAAVSRFLCVDHKFSV